MCLSFFLWQNFSNGITLSAFADFFLDISTLSYWCKSDYPLWYVSFIAIMYAAYPFLYRLYRNDKRKILLLIATSVGLVIVADKIDWPIYVNCERAFSRIPIFLSGLFVSDCVKENRNIQTRYLLLMALVSVALLFLMVFTSIFKVLPIFYTRYCYGVWAVSMIAIIGYILYKFDNIVFRYIDKFFSFIGDISFEIYVVHVMIIRIIKYYCLIEFSWYWYYICVLIFTIILSLLYKKIINSMICKKTV